MPLAELWLVRHGESETNPLAAEAERTGALRIAVTARDPDVALSPRGRDQAAAVGRALAAVEPDERPTATWVSSYRRARETAEIALAAAELPLPVRIDERLRDRELGILDALTSWGVRQLHPEEAERRGVLGKYYHRPPGGESWADVALRVRSVLRDLEDAGQTRVLVFCHDAVVMLFRSVCERLDEQALLEEAREHPVPNGSFTRLVRDGEGEPWRAAVVNDVQHLVEDEAAEVTMHAGDPHGTNP